MITDNKILFAIVSFCFLWASCGENQGNSPQVPSNQEKGSFNSFLNLFKQSEGFASWDNKVVDLLGDDRGVYDPEEIQNKTLLENFTEIKPEFHHFIPTRSIINLDPDFSDDIPDPLTAYQFWATHKVKADNYWLLCVFALKREWVAENGHREFNAHPVLLITYTEEGSLIDHFRWTFLIDDMEQINDADVDVFGDTLVRGYKPSFEAEALTEIHSKTIIGNQGKFRMIMRSKKETLPED